MEDPNKKNLLAMEFHSSDGSNPPLLNCTEDYDDGGSQFFGLENEDKLSFPEHLFVREMETSIVLLLKKRKGFRNYEDDAIKKTNHLLLWISEAPFLHHLLHPHLLLFHHLLHLCHPPLPRRRRRRRRHLPSASCRGRGAWYEPAQCPS